MVGETVLALVELPPVARALLSSVLALVALPPLAVMVGESVLALVELPPCARCCCVWLLASVLVLLPLSLTEPPKPVPAAVMFGLTSKVGLWVWAWVVVWLWSPPVSVLPPVLVVMVGVKLGVKLLALVPV